MVLLLRSPVLHFHFSHMATNDGDSGTIMQLSMTKFGPYASSRDIGACFYYNEHSTCSSSILDH